MKHPCLKYFLYLCLATNFIAGNSNETFLQPKAHESFLCDKVISHEPRAFMFNKMGYKKISVEIDGVFYESLKSASRVIGCIEVTIKNRCSSDDFPNYKIVPFRITYTEKKCIKCGKVLFLSEFHKSKAGRDGLRSDCKVCYLKYYREYRIKAYGKKGRSKHLDYEFDTIEYRRDARLLCVYNISLKEYNNLLHQQNYKCKICSIPQKELDKNLYVDHDHRTGKVRGLLCRHCNSGLGYFRDNTQILQNAIKYLI